MSTDLEVPFLKPEVIKDQAEAFLNQYHPSGFMPIPIEEIIEIGQQVSFDMSMKP